MICKITEFVVPGIFEFFKTSAMALSSVFLNTKKYYVKYLNLKYLPSSNCYWDSNSRPLESESPPVNTIRGLHPACKVNNIKYLIMGKRNCLRHALASNAAGLNGPWSSERQSEFLMSRVGLKKKFSKPFSNKQTVPT